MSQVFVKVTNKNEFPIIDHYDGVEWVMMPKKTINLPFHVAAHFFGIFTPDQIQDREKINRFIERRWGWNRPEIDRKKSQDYCNKLELSLAVFEMKEVDTTDDYLVAPRSKEDEKPSKKSAEAA